MNTEESKDFLTDRGIPTMNYPHGYLLKVSRREGSPSRCIEMDEDIKEYQRLLTSNSTTGPRLS
jgi:hypothetical protein